MTKTCLLLLGFAAALALRVLLGGPSVATSAGAGIAFAFCLTALGLAARTRFRVSRRAIIVGLLGGAALCIPSLIARLTGAAPHTPAGSFFAWALVVSAVAVAEEYFLRGALFDAAHDWLGDIPAVIIAAVAFAALHIPLYGWHVVPLDLAVGLWLGGLRLSANSPAASAIAHTLADLAGWWLR